jgi:hypothetical protein
MSAGTRYRLVTVTGGEEHVGSVVLSAQEAQEMLALEADLHARFGWKVTLGLRSEGGPLDCVIARRGERERLILCRAYEPLADC